jgi:type I restriction enzyme S subunit
LNITGASIGRSAVAVPELAGGNVNQHVCEIRLKRGVMDPDFVCAVLNSPMGQDQISSFQAGGNRQGLNFSQVGSIRVPALDFHQQQAIGAVIGDVDRLSATLEGLVAKNQAFREGMMQQLLSPRAGWSRAPLSDLADVIDPHPSHRAPPAVGNGVPFVGIGDLNSAGTLVGGGRLVDPAVLAEHLARYDFRDGLLGLGRVASIGKVVRFPVGPARYAVSPTMGVIRPTKTPREFLEYALRSRFVADQFAAMTAGSTRSSVGMESLRRLVIALPPGAEAQAIGRALSAMDDSLDALERRLTKARSVKIGMMQELLTGSTELPVGERAQ